MAPKSKWAKTLKGGFVGRFCKHCGSDNIAEIQQKFKDGTIHKRLECRDCGKFNGYAKQNNGYDRALVVNHEYENKGCIDDVAQIVIEQLNQLDLKGHTLTIILKVR